MPFMAGWSSGTLCAFQDGSPECNTRRADVSSVMLQGNMETLRLTVGLFMHGYGRDIFVQSVLRGGKTAPEQPATRFFILLTL